MYLDTVTVSYEMVADADYFFDVLAKVTKNQAF